MQYTFYLVAIALVQELAEKINMEEKIKTLNKILTSVNFLSFNSDDALSFLDNKYPNYNEANKKLVNSLELLTEENPQSLIDFIRTKIRDKHDIITLISDLNSDGEPGKNFRQKLNFISRYWELDQVFAIHSYLLGYPENKFVDLEKWNNPNRVFNSFTLLSYTKKHKELHRLVRNSASHKVSVNEIGKLLNEKGEVVCSTEDVDDIYTIIKSILDWIKDSFQLFIAKYYKFTFLVIYATINEYTSDKEKYNKIIVRLNIQFPDIFVMIEELKKKGVERKRLRKGKENIHQKEKNYLQKEILQSLPFYYRPIMWLVFKLDSYLKRKLIDKYPDEIKKVVVEQFELYKNIMIIIGKKLFDVTPQIDYLITRLTNKNDIAFFRLCRDKINKEIDKYITIIENDFAINEDEILDKLKKNV